MSPKKILIIGVGNEFRHDDAVGIEIARGIDKLSIPDVVISIQSGEGASLLESWQGYDCVFIIDAARSGLNAGKIHRFDAACFSLPSDFFNYSTHAFSVAEAVELARALNRLPKRLTVFGIEGDDFSSGKGLTEQVAAAALKVVAQITSEIDHEFQPA